MARLLDARGNPVDIGALKREILTEELSRTGGVRAYASDHPSVGLTPEGLASILREAEDGDPVRYFALAEEMEEKDPHYHSVLGTRKRQVAQLPVTVVDAGEDAADKAAGDLVREVIEQFDEDTLFDMLDAVGKGLSVTEVIWSLEARRWMPARFEWVDPRMLDFDDATRSIPMLKSPAGKMPLAPWKFITVSLKAKSGLPVRGGLARTVAWSYLFKNFDIKDWVRFCEAYGQPLRVGKFHAGATEAEKRSLLRSVAALGADAAAVIPAAMAIEFVEAKNQGGTGSLFEGLAKYLDQQVSKAVLGQTATTDAIAGGHAVSKEHNQVREDIEQSDAAALTRALMQELVRPVVDLNLGPRPKSRYPKIVIGRPQAEDAELIIRAARELVPLGFRVSQAQIRRVVGIQEPEDGDELLGAPAEGPSEGGLGTASGTAPDGARGGRRLSVATREASLRPQSPYSPLKGPSALDRGGEIALARAGGGNRDAIDALAEQLIRETEAAENAMVERLAALVNDRSITSLEELGRRLLEHSPGLAPPALAAALAEAMSLAELIGRSEIADGA